jgi:hypothetical protein
MYALLQGATGRRWGWLALGGALYLLALGSYEQPIMLVAVVGALAFWRRRDWGAGAHGRSRLPRCALFLSFALRFAATCRADHLSAPAVAQQPVGTRIQPPDGTVAP